MRLANDVQLYKPAMILHIKLEIWGRAQREAARRRKSDSGDILEGRNSAHSNATWRVH